MNTTRPRLGDDWTSRTLSDWMDVPPSEWLDQAISEWNRGYELWMSTPPAELWRVPYGRSGGPGTIRPPVRRRRRASHERRCRGCGHEPCECFCCIGDVDLVVYARAGERRVVPVELENSRRREKEVEVELNEWRTPGGHVAPVETVHLEPTKLTLPPCGQGSFTLVVETGGAEDANASNRKVGGDVDRCLVATADLRLVGCDHRPLRIAVAILPRNCDPFRTTCGCACC